MAGTPATLRRTPLALATALVLVAGMLTLGMAGASAAPAIRLYSPELTTNTGLCVAPGSVNRFTAKITNNSSSPLGSAMFHSNTANGFRNISFRSFTRPEATGGKRWQALPDIVDGDGIYLRAASSSQALSLGESVTVTFQAKAPSSSGAKTWVTKAWQSTLFLSGSFSATVNPSVRVGTDCPATFPNGGTVTAPGAALQVVPNDTINCNVPYDGTFPGFAGTVQITPDPDDEEWTGHVFFDDPNGADHLHAPFCKGGVSEDFPVILTYPEDSCASEDPTPCIETQDIGGGGHLLTTLLIDEFDPPVRH
jgi:hypothetical protein